MPIPPRTTAEIEAAHAEGSKIFTAAKNAAPSNRLGGVVHHAVPGRRKVVAAHAGGGANLRPLRDRAQR